MDEPSSASPHLTQAEIETHRWIQQHVVPVLGEGVVCAMRDQPNDPAAYLAEFLAAKGAGPEVAATLKGRKLAGECARLDSELAALHEQLEAARAEAQRRLPNATLLESLERDEAKAAASWAEMRRLKKLMRSMKIKTGVPLDASDWLLPEGLILVQASPGVDTSMLCGTLARDFGALAYAWQPGEEKAAAQLGGVRAALEGQPGCTLLLQGRLDGLSEQDATAAVQSLAEWTGQKPTALLLLVEGEPKLADPDGASDTDTHPDAKLKETAEARHAWLSFARPRIEAACQAAMLTVLHVTCDGDFDDQMSSLLVAVSSD